MSLTWLPPDPGTVEPPRAAFAVGRATGGAVVRNRIRRRVRAALRALQAAAELPAGTYLVGGSPRLASMPWPQLLADLAAAVHAAATSAPASRAR